jgi:hypothetical protein
MPNSEGFGTQYIFIMAAIFYAEVINKQFFYSPFAGMAHNYDNDPNFLEKKEKLVHLIDYFPINYNLDLQLKINRSCHFPNCYKDLQSFKILKNLFFADKEKQQYFNDSFTNIAIHIRKLNPVDTGQIALEISNYRYCSLIKEFRKKLHPASMQFHIYSQGSTEQFKALISENVFLHLNESIEDTFTALALADILVIAPSCLSYSAGLLSNGLVFYFHDSVQAPFPHWQPIPFVIQKPG